MAARLARCFAVIMQRAAARSLHVYPTPGSDLGETAGYLPSFHVYGAALLPQHYMILHCKHANSPAAKRVSVNNEHLSQCSIVC